MLKKFDKYAVGLTRQFIEDALKEVEEKLGITVDLKKIRYGDNYFRCGLEVNLGSADDARHIRWNRDCGKYRLLPEHLGKQFIFKGESYVTWDIEKNRTSYPIVAKNLSKDRLENFRVDALKKVILVGERNG